MANAGLVKELQDRGGDKPLSPDQMSAIKAKMAATGPAAYAASTLPSEAGKAGIAGGTARRQGG